ncbi:flagellar basal body-associated protein FliL [Sporosarcina pasteurii]|uniref:flagellar basal body-associated protein FliL n=1 Tax=Sporosarcina pasteurii TaxID=1474 RepID=UPI000E1C3B58|nr:flagellar basal body-associated protein FliL [Sporosarcina pasteurii]MDS9470589.1 flagellar basal body-associated protein FliL [Sporosarcina pasteurii]QBQ07103.1 flagellar basal body-associated protein FliL [Sporosarcina pasteurii]
MLKNKILTITLIILVTITLVAVILLALAWQFNKSGDVDKDVETTIDEIIESSVDIPEITTNLAGRQFIRISLKIQTDSDQAAEELKKREFQVKNIVIHELSEITQEELEGKAGKQAFESTIQSLLNPLMQSGEIERVYIVSSIIQ